MSGNRGSLRRWLALAALASALLGSVHATSHALKSSDETCVTCFVTHTAVPSPQVSHADSPIVLVATALPQAERALVPVGTGPCASRAPPARSLDRS
ncbi:MAG: hypothetical protein GY725_04240 [bacterium]|nr:hypothetical protein [bacterium]